MKVKLLVISLLSVLAIAGCAAPTDSSQPSESAPTASLLSDKVVTAQVASFDQASFDQAISEGKDVFVDFYANWCPTCIANSPHIEAALGENSNDNLVAFKADYDNETALKKQFGINKQSTLMLIKGGDTETVSILGPGTVSKREVSEFLNS